MIRAAKAVAAAIVLPIAGYAAAGMVSGTIPANAGWHAPAQGVTIFVESNGVHTGIVVPKVAADIDWRARVPASDLADPRDAAFGSKATLIHVEHIPARRRPPRSRAATGGILAARRLHFCEFRRVRRA